MSESSIIWEEATDRGILSVPLSETVEERPFLTHIVPIWTRQRYSYWLAFHLHFCGFCTFPVEYPIVPKGQSRVRISFHADNTIGQVEALVAAICEWAQEMMEIEEDTSSLERIPRAARRVYAALNENTNGYESNHADSRL